MQTIILHHDKIREILAYNTGSSHFKIEVVYPENDFFVYSYIQHLIIEEDNQEAKYVTVEKFNTFVEKYLSLPEGTAQCKFIIRRQYIRDISFTIDVLEHIKLELLQDDKINLLMANNSEIVPCCILL